MRVALTRTQRVLVGATTLVLLLGVVGLGLKAALGAYGDDYRLVATFDRAGQSLDETSTVKMRGVTVGSIHRIALRDDGKVDVTLSIRKEIDVPTTTVASAEPLSVFGPKFIRLEPGAGESSGPYLKSGDSIARTESPTEVTDLLARTSRLLDAVDPMELFTVVHTLGRGLDGQGPTLARLLDNTTTVVGVVSNRKTELVDLLGDTGTLAQQLGSRGQTIAQLTRDLQPLLEQVATDGDELGRLLASTVRLTGGLDGVIRLHAAAIDPIFAGLGPTVALLFTNLDKGPAFLQANNSLLQLLGVDLLRYPLGDGHIVGVLRGAIPDNPCKFLLPTPCP